MKETVYKCDRCGAELGTDGQALERKRFGTLMQIKYKIRFFGNWKTGEPVAIAYELCEKCRNALDDWLESYKP